MHSMLARLLVAWAVVHCAYGYLEIVNVEPQIEIVSSSRLIPAPQILPLPVAPPYTSSARTTVAIINFIKQNTAFPLTSTRRNFISLMFGVRAMAEGVSSGLNFESVHSTVSVLVLLGKLMPESARDLLVTRYDDELSKIRPVLKLIREICPSGCGDYDCDQKINRIIKKNPVYRASARLLLEAGKLWERFDQLKRLALKAAVEDRVADYLSRNRYILRPLIEQDALVLNLERSF